MTQQIKRGSHNEMTMMALTTVTSYMARLESFKIFLDLLLVQLVYKHFQVLKLSQLFHQLIGHLFYLLYAKLQLYACTD